MTVVSPHYNCIYIWKISVSVSICGQQCLQLHGSKCVFICMQVCFWKNTETDAKILIPQLNYTDINACGLEALRIDIKMARSISRAGNEQSTPNLQRRSIRPGGTFVISTEKRKKVFADIIAIMVGFHVHGHL